MPNPERVFAWREQTRGQVVGRPTQLRPYAFAILSAQRRNPRGNRMRARAVLVLCLALATVAGAINAARAADYPTRPIKLVVPYPAGGPTDVLGRMVADFLTRDLKQTVFVENKGGAQGAIGAEAAARAEPDGYTLFFTVASIVVLNPVLYKKLAYDPDRDFRVLAIVTDSPVVMVVHPSVPAKSVAEFVAYAKQNPGKLNFGSAGTGGTIHLAGEMFRQVAGIEMTHVPYKGTFCQFWHSGSQCLHST
jgi:tripartite-type tricarboxylate transporter receptor subunit TctC